MRECVGSIFPPPLSLPVSHTHTHTLTRATTDKHNKKLTKAHFLCQLKGKISRFPQQINSNEWFIICLKHGSSWMWSFRPPSLGLIYLLITQTSRDHSSVEHNLGSEWSVLTWPRIRAGNTGKHLNKSILRMAVSCPAGLLSCLTSRLRGVYLWHKEGALPMPRACQQTHDFPQLWELSGNKRSTRSSYGAISVNRHPCWSLFFFVSRCYWIIDMHKSSVSAARNCLWVSPSVRGVFTWTNSLSFLKRPWWSLGWQNFVLLSKNRYPWCYFGCFVSVCVNTKKKKKWA